MVRVHVVDDSVLIRKRLKDTLPATDSGEYDSRLNLLEAMFNDRLTVKVVRRKSNEIQFESDDHGVDWHGGVLLICEQQPAPEGESVAR